MKNSNNLEARVYELGENLELELEEIFDIVCQEFQINGDSIARELGCKCPYALTDMVSELTQEQLSQSSLE